MARLDQNDRWAVGLIWLVACGFAADWAGLHYMVGAFLSGAVLDARWFGQDRMDQFRGTVLLTIMPVYFLSTGLRTTWDMGGAQVFGVAAILLVAAVGGKLAGSGWRAACLGWGPRRNPHHRLALADQGPDHDRIHRHSAGPGHHQWGQL